MVLRFKWICVRGDTGLASFRVQAVSRQRSVCRGVPLQDRSGVWATCGLKSTGIRFRMDFCFGQLTRRHADSAKSFRTHTSNPGRPKRWLHLFGTKRGHLEPHCFLFLASLCSQTNRGSSVSYAAVGETAFDTCTRNPEGRARDHPIR